MLTMSMADLEQFIVIKNKPVIYIRKYIEFYNQKNHKEVYKIYKMVELKEMYALTAKNLYNLNIYQIINISMDFCNLQIIYRDKDKVIF